jgi:hypothetical protein
MTIQFGERAIFLDCAPSARVTGRRIQFGGLLDGEGIFVVGRTFAAGRVRSQLVIGHGLMITRRPPPRAGYPQVVALQGNLNPLDNEWPCPHLITSWAAPPNLPYRAKVLFTMIDRLSFYQPRAARAPRNASSTNTSIR